MKKVFISYSGFDKNKVRTLFNKLKKERHLQPIVVEYDRDAMKYLPDKIVSNLKKTDYIVPIITRNSIKTQYMNQEIGYAKAIDIPIIPIVEIEIMNDLRGFINSQNDLSYNFKGYLDDTKKERKSFRNCCDILIEDLVNQITLRKSNQKISLSNIFKGRWSNHFVFPDGQTGTEPFEIKSNNKYFIGDEYMFKLDRIFISKDRKKVRFRKSGVREGDNRKVINVLKFVKPGMYVGDEEGNKVTYSKND